MSVRSDIAAAASTVAGVSVVEYYRQTPKTGDGWVSLARTDRDENGDFMDRWAVSVVTSQDLKVAEKWVEDHLDELISALSPVLIVTAAFPAELRVDQGFTNGLAIEGSRAH